MQKVQGNERAQQRDSDKHRIALVLQGGGSLGAYQALHKHALTPDWVIGTSIGAITAALIAENPGKQSLAH